ncbi:MAG: hypothetical protein HUU23_17895 [Caldilineales bacterium]|nr:hypothetical protein [Caldilineales bacterium]
MPARRRSRERGLKGLHEQVAGRRTWLGNLPRRRVLKKIKKPLDKIKNIKYHQGEFKNFTLDF